MPNNRKKLKASVRWLLALSLLFCTMVSTVGATGLTDCQLNHDHPSEICEINHKGKLLDWNSVPSVWEYTWDNSQSCWYHGMWYNGYKFTTPQGEFDTDVRNKISMHSDGEYLYLDVVKATVAGPGAINGYGVQITVDGKQTQFQFLLANASASAAGTYPMVLKHENSALSGQNVAGSQGYTYLNNSGYNGEFEVKLPLAALKAQNPSIDLDNINEISFYSPHLMCKPVTITGISTFPYALGGICLAGVALIVYRMTKGKQGAIA